MKQGKRRVPFTTAQKVLLVVFLVTLAVVLAQAAFLAFGWYVSMRMLGPGAIPADASSIGIIGGADGPTAIFVTTNSSAGWGSLVLFLLPLLACAACGIGLLVSRRRAKR